MTKKKFALPTAITLVMIVIVLAAASTWVLPAGQYSKLTAEGSKHFLVSSKTGVVSLPFSQQTLDSLSIRISLDKFAKGEISRPISVPNTYQREETRPQGFVSILQAPVKGIINSIDIVLFILIMGGFIQVFNATGAMLNGVKYLAFRMKGREQLLIVMLTFVFSFCGGSYGMDVDSIVFYPVLVPLFVAAGYDLMVPLAIVFGGSAIGYISSFSNPFSTIIASNTLGINWMEGFYTRILFFIVSTSLFAWYLLRYASRVKKNPSVSLVVLMEAPSTAPQVPIADQYDVQSLSGKMILQLCIFLLTFTAMITGIVFYGWWCIEMSALFLGAAILVALVDRMSEKSFVGLFIKGMESLLSVAVIVGLARGVTIILNDGLVSDSILYYTSGLVGGFSPVLFIILVMLFYFFFTIPVSSSSGMAVLTMPIIGSLAILLNIPGKEVVNSYLYGIGIMYLISPTANVFPALMMVNVTYKAWIRFIMPVVIGLLLLATLFLVVGVNFSG